MEMKKSTKSIGAGTNPMTHPHNTPSVSFEQWWSNVITPIVEDPQFKASARYHGQQDANNQVAACKKAAEKGWNARQPELDAKEAECASLREELRRVNGVLAGGWIKFSERMPDDGVHVLLARDERITCVAYYDVSECCFCDISRDHDYQVIGTHWMPLPPPPQADKRGAN